MTATARMREWARAIETDIVALYIAARDPRVPWYVKLAAAAVAAYALSPIDLIPDFIPVLGYLDDVIIVPLGIVLVIKDDPRSAYGGIPRGGAEAVRAPDKPSGGGGGDHRPLDCCHGLDALGVLANACSIMAVPRTRLLNRSYRSDKSGAGISGET